MKKPAQQRWVIWALHDKVKRWLPVHQGLSQQEAVMELVLRQDRVRRLGEPCMLRTLPEGQTPQSLPAAPKLRRG